VTLRRLDLAAEMYHLLAPQKIPLVISTDEVKRLLAVSDSLKARVMLSLSYGCGLRGARNLHRKRHMQCSKKRRHSTIASALACSCQGHSQTECFRGLEVDDKPNRPRQCSVPSWRSRISSAITARHNV
jgi:hypothetical protein